MTRHQLPHPLTLALNRTKQNRGRLAASQQSSSLPLCLRSTATTVPVPVWGPRRKRAAARQEGEESTAAPVDPQEERRSEQQQKQEQEEGLLVRETVLDHDTQGKGSSSSCSSGSGGRRGVWGKMKGICTVYARASFGGICESFSRPIIQSVNFTLHR